VKDFHGNELAVDDKVVFTCGSHGHALYSGVIVGFTPKNAQVMYSDRYAPRDTKPLLMDSTRIAKQNP
jgi:hypothetical protein